MFRKQSFSENKHKYAIPANLFEKRVILWKNKHKDKIPANCLRKQVTLLNKQNKHINEKEIEEKNERKLLIFFIMNGVNNR